MTARTLIKGGFVVSMAAGYLRAGNGGGPGVTAH